MKTRSRDSVSASGTQQRLLGQRLGVLYRQKKTCIIIALYTFTCISLVTTCVFWSLVNTKSATGNIESTPADFEINGNGFARGLRNVIDSYSGQSDLNDLFVIQPDTNLQELIKEKDRIIAELLRMQKTMEESPNAVHGSNSSAFTWRSDTSLCPEYDIPGLVGKRKLDLKDVLMSESEKIIFGTDLDDVRTAVAQANDTLRKKLDSAKAGNITAVDWLFDSAIKSHAMLISNYMYLPGGHWKPKDCIPRWKVAIIIPFRDRAYHLPIVLRYLIPMLQRQFLEFSFFTIEQANQELFNRAMLMNVGFLEALNFTDYDCFIFHDVDHVPLDDHNYYGCNSMPRHFLSGADRWNYKLPYDGFFGAVSGLTKGQIRQINGFPNVYWGWGGEDDEIWNRLKEVGLPVSRPKGPMGHYDVIKHHHKSAPMSKERHNLLNNFKARYRDDGLSDIVYPSPEYELHTLYTNVSVDIHRIKPHYQLPATNNNNAPKKPAQTNANEPPQAGHGNRDDKTIEGGNEAGKDEERHSGEKEDNKHEDGDKGH